MSERHFSPRRTKPQDMERRDRRLTPSPTHRSESPAAKLPAVSRGRGRSRSRSKDRDRTNNSSLPAMRSRSSSRQESLSPYSKRMRLSANLNRQREEANSETAVHQRVEEPVEDREERRHRHPSRRSTSRRRQRSRSRSVSRSRLARYKSEKSGCRVYFGNLAYDCRREDLKHFAREAGTVVNVEIMKTSSGRSKGCGIVEFSRPEYADRAIRKLNKVDFMGRPVFVREDRELEQKPPKDPRDASEDQRIFVGNMPFSTSWQDLKDLFRKAGRVTHTDVQTDPETRRPLGIGLVIFDDPRDARTAIEMFNGYEYRGRRLHVCEERNAPPPPSRLEIRESRDHVGEYRRSGNFDYRGRITPQPGACNGPYSRMPPPLQAYASRYPPNASLPPPQHFVAPPMGFVGGPGASLPSHGPNQIFVNNLPYSTTWQDLIDLFRHVGPVVRAEILTLNGHPKGSGLVRFEQFSVCERAVAKFNGYLYGGRYLDVRLDKFSTPA